MCAERSGLGAMTQWRGGWDGGFSVAYGRVWTRMESCGLSLDGVPMRLGELPCYGV